MRLSGPPPHSGTTKGVTLERRFPSPALSHLVPSSLCQLDTHLLRSSIWTADFLIWTPIYLGVWSQLPVGLPQNVDGCPKIGCEVWGTLGVQGIIGCPRDITWVSKGYHPRDIHRDTQGIGAAHIITRGSAHQDPTTVQPGVLHLVETNNRVGVD